MPNLVAYNSGNTISNSIQFGTIVMDVNGDVAQGSLIWCPDFGICNQYIIVTDSYTNGKTNQLDARAMGFQTSGLTDSDLIQGINKLASSKFAGPFGTLSDAINWAIYEGYFITNQEYPTIVTSGCVLNLDSNFPPSYPLVFDTWYDLTGNGNTGLLNNGITYNSSLRGSLVLNGTDQYVSFSATTGIPIGNSDYTISVWFNPDSLGDDGLVGWGNYGSINEVNALRLTSSGIVNYWWVNDLTVSYSFTLGSWYNAVAKFDGTTRSIWINGSLIGSDTPTGHNVPYSSNLTVGLTNTTEFFDGNMGEVQIFDRALSSDEILFNYNALLPRYNGTYTDPCDIAPFCTPTPTGTAASTPAPTSTPTITPSQTPLPIFLLNSTPNLPSGGDACNDYNINNRVNYYSSRSNGGTITTGTFLYTSLEGVGNPSFYIPDGYYSNGTLYWFFQNGSTSDVGTPCNIPTSTPTSTTTQTPTPTGTPSSTTPSGTPTATPCSYTVWNLYYPCGTTTEADQLIPYDANLAPGVIVKLTNGLCYTIALAACFQTPGSFTVDSEYSTCEDCEQTYPTPTSSPTATPTPTPILSPMVTPTPTPTPTSIYYYYLVYDVNINCNAFDGVVYRTTTDYSSSILTGQYAFVNGDTGTLKYVETTFEQAFVDTLNSIIITTCIIPSPTMTPTPSVTPETYYKLDACSPATGQGFTNVAPGIANQRYFDSTNAIFYVWDNTTTTTPGTIVSVVTISGESGCP